jgi:predicted PurR-regulated permease PerM
MKGAIPHKVIRQVFLLAVIVIIGLIIYDNMKTYLSGVLGAITLFVISRGFMKKFNNWGWPKGLSAGLIIVFSFFVILIPLAGVVFMLSTKIGDAIKNSEAFLNAAKMHIANLEQYVGYNIAEEIDTSSIAVFISKNAQNFALGTFDAFISVSIMYFLLYFMLVGENKMMSSLKEFLPVGKHNLKVISIEVRKKVNANAVGIPLVALFQGVIALIGFWIFNVPDPFFWFVITAVGSVIPFVGTAIGILPVVIILLSQGMTFEAIGILIYGVVVVGSSDNLIRLLVLKRMADEHPLITLVGVIVGIPVFGFIGLIFGPLLVSLFLLIVSLYNKEFGDKNQSELVLSTESGDEVVANQGMSKEDTSANVNNASESDDKQHKDED